MVVEVLCSENAMSPRISFSHDFSQFDVIPVERINHPLRSNSSSSSRLNSSSSIDFDFHVHDELASLENQTSSADELFSDGRIVPTQIKNTKKEEFNNNNSCIHIHNVSNPVEPLTTRTNPSEEQSVVTTTTNNNDGIIIRKKETKEMSNSKSFWSFKRSSSCGSGYGRRLCPLPLLSRSNSTGSSPKRVPLSSSMKQQNSQKHYYSYSSTTTRSCSSSNSNNNNNNLKPPLKRSHNNNSVRVNPVLNVAPVTLFSFRSIFSNNRDRSKKK